MWASNSHVDVGNPKIGVPGVWSRIVRLFAGERGRQDGKRGSSRWGRSPVTTTLDEPSVVMSGLSMRADLVCTRQPAQEAIQIRRDFSPGRQNEQIQRCRPTDNPPGTIRIGTILKAERSGATRAAHYHSQLSGRGPGEVNGIVTHSCRQELFSPSCAKLRWPSCRVACSASKPG